MLKRLVGVSAGKIGSTILFRSFVTRIGIYYLFHIRIYRFASLGKSHSRDVVRNNRPDDRVIISSLHTDNRNLDKDHNNFYRQRCKKRDEGSLCLLQILRRPERSEDAPKLSRLVHFKTLQKKFPREWFGRAAETVRIVLKFHYDLFASSILHVSSCRRWRSGAFSGSQFMRIG